jgi:hypothetical protein
MTKDAQNHKPQASEQTNVFWDIGYYYMMPPACRESNTGEDSRSCCFPFLEK